MSVGDVLADLRTAFDALGLRWYVFGAQAVTALGRPRMTADLDVTVALDDLSPVRLAAELTARGFEPAFPFDAEFVATTRVMPFRHVACDFPVDIVLAGPGLEEHFLERATPLDCGGATVPVIAPEHLVVTKILAGRPQDLEDVRALLARPSLDHDEIDQLLTSVAAALGDGELLPRWQALRGARR